MLAVRKAALSQPIKRWFQLYALAWVVSFVALSFAWIMPGLSQPMIALSGMRWVFFFMLGVACFTQGKGFAGLFLAAFAFELAAGLGTYFADFKTVFVITFFAALASGTRVSSRALLGAGVLALLVVALAIVWTAVKGEYRVFVSGGQAAQIVAVDLGSRLAKLYELAANLDVEALTGAFDHLLRRLTYVEFFGVVLTYVPAYIPHTLGAILWDAIIRPFMPRLLFVDKEVIDDTARTNLYTGGTRRLERGNLDQPRLHRRGLHRLRQRRHVCRAARHRPVLRNDLPGAVSLAPLPGAPGHGGRDCGSGERRCAGEQLHQGLRRRDRLPRRRDNDDRLHRAALGAVAGAPLMPRLRFSTSSPPCRCATADPRARSASWSGP